MECMYCGGEHAHLQCPKIYRIRYVPLQVENKIQMQVAEIEFFPPREVNWEKFVEATKSGK